MKFIVINAKTGPSRYPFVHNTIESAQAEAGRIAACDPGAKVYVLQVVGYMQELPATWHSKFANDARGRIERDCLAEGPYRQHQSERAMTPGSDDNIPF